MKKVRHSKYVLAPFTQPMLSHTLLSIAGFVVLALLALVSSRKRSWFKHLITSSSLFILGLIGCSKSSKPDLSFWTQRASSEEQLTATFASQAADLLSRIEYERRNISASESEFASSEMEAGKLRDEVGKQIRTRRDRDLYWLLNGYYQKVSAMHMLSHNPGGAKYLPAFQSQVQSCHDELQALFATRPVGNPPLLPMADEPCTAKVPEQ